MRPPLALLALAAPLAASVGACVRAEGPPTQLAALTPPGAVGGAEEGAAPGGTMPLPPPPPYFPPGPERDREWLKLAPKAAVDPALARTVVDYPTTEKPGTIVVSTPERRLYLVMPGGKAMRYPVSVGKEGASWAGVANVDRKMEWPDWNPPKEMLARKPELPTRLEGGPLNPIGARSLFLAEGKRDTLFRIHGTNEPEKIGHAVSSGCIRMLNEDVMDLYERVPIGTKVVVIGDGSVPVRAAEPETPRTAPPAGRASTRRS